MTLSLGLRSKCNWLLSGMKLITACGPNIFPDQAEKATMLVPHQCMPLRRMTEQTTGSAMILTIHNAPDLFADSHTSATSASDLVTTRESVINTSLWDHLHWQQLHKSTFRPVTPVQVDKLEQLLQGHPNSELVWSVVDGFCFGLSLKYTGPRVNRQPRN